MQVTNYSTPNPLEPPMVEVLVDHQWWPGHVRAQEKRDGNWYITVTYSHDGHNALGGFWEHEVRPDDTDHSHGRSVGDGT